MAEQKPRKPRSRSAGAAPPQRRSARLAPLAVAEAETLVLPADTLLQHETCTTGGRSNWKQTWVVQTRQRWPAECPLCQGAPATVGAHVTSYAFRGVGIVPCCSGCNTNPGKAVRRSTTKVELTVLLVSAHEMRRIAAQQRAVEGVTVARATCARCDAAVCQKGACGGRSAKYCCAHCYCRPCRNNNNHNNKKA